MYEGLRGAIFALMSEQSESRDRWANLWAPWRMEYIEGLDETGDDCFLCRYRDDPDRDKENLVLWRGKGVLVVMNRFPYNGGHALVAPLEHVADLSSLSPETMLEMMEFVRDLQRILKHTINPQGFNIGINIGPCAGAGLPGHVHIHVVPRWVGDTNFMAVMSKTRVVSQHLDELYARLRRTGEEMGLPRPTG